MPICNRPMPGIYIRSRNIDTERGTAEDALNIVETEDRDRKRSQAFRR